MGPLHGATSPTHSANILYTYYIHIIYILYTYYIHIIIYIYICVFSVHPYCSSQKRIISEDRHAAGARPPLRQLQRQQVLARGRLHVDLRGPGPGSVGKSGGHQGFIDFDLGQTGFMMVYARLAIKIVPSNSWKRG